MKQEWINEITQAFDKIGVASGNYEFPPAELGKEMHEIAIKLPEFRQANLTDLESFSLYRTMLYNLVKKSKPTLIIETGVLNGFSSAFILQALADNNHGMLISIDLPHNSGEYEEQGTFLLPRGQSPGWAIPNRLRSRHEIHLGKAESLLPKIIEEKGAPDIFLHDSDHRYPHMMMEISFAWSRMTHGIIASDNIEQNSAFLDFAQGVSAPHAIVSSYNSPERVWQHGLMKK